MWSAGTPLYVFQILLVKSSSQWENALFGYTCNPYRRGGGGRSIRKLWPLGIPDITIKTCVCWDETRISHLYHYVCEQLEILLIFSSEFTSNIQQPIINSKHSRTCNRYRKGGGGSIRKLWLLGIPNITIKTWVCWDETRISQLYHYVCEQLEILLMFFFFSWIHL